MPEDNQSLLKTAYSLVRQQSTDGSWSAFQLRPGGSNHWTTAAALTALGSVERRQGTVPRWLQQAQQRGWTRLEQDSVDQPLGFNTVTPTDADSTTWLCRALVQRCFNFKNTHQHDHYLASEKWLKQCLTYIEKHLEPNKNGIKTYIESDQILEFVGQPGINSSWLGVHHCVGANAMELGKELQNYLPDINANLSRQLASLEIKNEPFWWTDELIIELLRKKCRQHGQKIKASSLILRVPYHHDRTGDSTIYSSQSDIEGGTCGDNGIFSDVLSLLLLN